MGRGVERHGTNSSAHFDYQRSAQSKFCPHIRAIEKAAAGLNITTSVAEVRDRTEIDQAIRLHEPSIDTGLIILPGPVPARHRAYISDLAAQKKFPAVYPYRYFVTGGGLVSYGIDTVDVFRQAATYVDRILRGEAPGDLPIQAPTKFEMVLNLKTAKALELQIPPMLLARADEVIE